MALIGGEGLYGFGASCPVHGEEASRECRICGAEYCGICHRAGRMCPDCAAESHADGPVREADFDDVDNLDRLLRDNGLSPARRKPAQEREDALHTDDEEVS